MVKPLKNLKIFDPNLSLGENWRKADPLNYAWFAYSPFEMQERYRASGSNPEGVGLALQFEMRLGLRERIADGEIIAFGISITPLGNSEPEKIPASYFAANSINLDWDGDAVSGLGRTYGEVRVCLSSPSVQKPKAATNKATAKRGGGRPSLYADAKIILDELLSDPMYAGLPAEPLRDPFNARFVSHYSKHGRKVAAVSERTLRNYLKRYRQELEENWQELIIAS